jgi:hypothetical protein
MSRAIYIRINSRHFKKPEIESSISAFVRDLQWVDDHTLKADLDDFGRVQLKLMFASFQHDLGITLSGILGFDADDIMEGFLNFACEYRPGKLTGAAELLLLEKLTSKNELMTALDRHFEIISRDEMETARMYLETGRNVNASAQHLYLHRNTFRYRLNKFINQTGLDIRETDQGKLMDMWFQLHDMD